MVNNKYKTRFSPTDFDLIISDESHRLLGGGNSRSLFEYFLGYKLGLTATPKDYLKNVKSKNIDNPREMERRKLLDTYTTFGCENGQPTYRYTLTQGATDKFLVQPIIVDARTEVTTKLLSEEGYDVLVSYTTNESEEVQEEVIYTQRHFERKFFSEETNILFCKTFLENGLKDPISGEFGKSLVFAVSQNHAARLTQILNEYAHQLWKGKYDSDFAIQVTSKVMGSQQMTIDFSNDKLQGFSKWMEGYKTSKARVCVTVGMMTTGWDCPNILNLALMRPVFSPTEFIQMKGRGTRKFNFQHEIKNELDEKETTIIEKTGYKLFDFFAVCEYFEERFDYDEVLKLPMKKGGAIPPEPPQPPPKEFEFGDKDYITFLKEKPVDVMGMKVDRMFYQKFEEAVKNDKDIVKQIEAGNMESAIAVAMDKYIDKPEEYFTVEKLRKALKIDRKISIREIIELVFFGNKIKGKEDLLSDEFEKFISIIKPENVQDLTSLKYFFYAYITDSGVRDIIDQQDFTELNHNSTFNSDDYSRVDDEMRTVLPTYIKNYVPLNSFKI